MYQDIITGPQDLRHLAWSQTRRSSGTAGSFLKSFDDYKGKRRYYKISNYDSWHGITGHECINELIADRLLSVLQIPHLHYQLIDAWIQIGEQKYRTWLCRSEDFRHYGERKIALDTYYQLERLPEESPLAFCIRNGWRTFIDQMLLVDYLILNRDRHGANMEVLQDRKSKSVRPAPLFDHGLSLLFSCKDTDSLAGFDVMEDRPVQSFVGSRSAKENLSLLSPAFLSSVHPLAETDRDCVLQGLEQALPEGFPEKIWEMIWRRWQSLESVFH